MLKIIFTLDYEIHGNGEGCSHALMVEPTHRMLQLFDEYGARLTIMADIAEILKFKEYAEQKSSDDYFYANIVSQLRQAVAGGHDVQLHLHASYFNAHHDGVKWAQDWSEYDFASLELKRLHEIVRIGKTYLESTLQRDFPDYRCIAFRAANWSVNPGRNVVKALLDNGIKLDTSIFKYGRRNGIVKFDYSNAESEMVPWRVHEDELCSRDDQGRLWEFPIYSENRWMGAFISSNRFYRVAQSRRHRVSDQLGTTETKSPKVSQRSGLWQKLTATTKKHAWKADFNQCTGRQLIAALLRAEKRHGSGDFPFVLIGHSKLFNRANEKSLRPFLEFVASHPKRFGFATFGSFQQQLDSNPSKQVIHG